jgi:tRNA1(Val) A37 N6-methylase TrmN6
MPVVEPAEQLTDDAALGGRLHLLQPLRGHRFGHDAILLAAATPARSGDRVADLGAGIGAAGIALASRVPGARVTLVEIDQRLAALGQENATRNGFAAFVDAVALDVAASSPDFAAAGLAAGSCDIVLMNPPFHDKALPASPDPRRRGAHSLEAADLARWVAAAKRLLRPRCSRIARPARRRVRRHRAPAGASQARRGGNPGASRRDQGEPRPARNPAGPGSGWRRRIAHRASRGGAASRRRVGAHRALIGIERSGCRGALGVIVGPVRK